MLRLAEFLETDPVRSAAPEVVAGDIGAAGPVGWVHTSEIAEIGPLLQGGEVLLTTGLGLRGLDAEDLRAYVHELADHGAVALCIELGRTFRRVPREIVEAADARGLVVVALHRVVPFVDVTREVHARIVNARDASLRRRERYSARLDDVLLAGRGPAAVVREVAALADAGAAFTAPDGRIVASAGAVPEAPADAWRSRAVVVQGTRAGFLCVGSVAGAATDDLLARGAVALGLALTRSGETALGGGDAARAALGDLVRGLADGPGEAATRLALVGAPAGTVRAYLGTALVVTAPERLGAVEQALRQLAGEALPWSVIGSVDEVLCGVLGVEDPSPDRVRARLDRLANSVSQRVGGDPGVVRAVAAGPLVGDLDDVDASLTDAVETAGLAAHLSLGERVVLAEDAALLRLLVRFAEDPALERFVDARIGAVLDHDAAQGSEDLATLEAYIQTRGSKTSTAHRLGVRRQTVYQRIERLERLLGGSLDDPTRWLGVSLALLARTVRTAGPVRPTHRGTLRRGAEPPGVTR